VGGCRWQGWEGNKISKDHYAAMKLGMQVETRGADKNQERVKGERGFL
jgi:hypothetical protein